MSSPLIIFAAAWLLVIGYTLFFVGYENWIDKPTSFFDALGLNAWFHRTAPTPLSSAIGPIPVGASSSGFGSGAGAGKGGGGGGGGAW